MASWLIQHGPTRFDQLALPAQIQGTLEALSTRAEPPHLLIAGPSGSGKTTAVRLLARQILGPGWASTTHILQGRDLARTSGAMMKFESFLRPGGGSSSETLAGRISLDAYDRRFSMSETTVPPPSGAETRIPEGVLPISRLIVLEDADHLGHRRQAYLRRMMERDASTSRFILTARTPSGIIDALRSRMRIIRFPSVPNERIEMELERVLELEGVHATSGITGDLAHLANGDLRKALLLAEVLGRRNRLDRRGHVQEILTSLHRPGVQMMVEDAFRGRIHDWRWEKVGARNVRRLHGAMGWHDRLIKEEGMDALDIVEATHQLIIRGRVLYPDPVMDALLGVLAETDVDLRESMHGRIHIERMLYRFHRIAETHHLTA